MLGSLPRLKTPLHFGRSLPPKPVWDARPDWQQADLAWIRHALAHSQVLPGGGWFAIDAVRRFGAAPRRMRVAGRDLVVWRAQGVLHAAPDACPHMGASLSEGRVHEGCLECPWHGLRLGTGGDRAHGFRLFKTHDDGVVLWVQLPDVNEATTQAPHLAPRPRVFLEGVVRTQARCAPRDVIQNRLDPWHGAHYHPHAFADLRVLDRKPTEITVRVSYRVLGPLAMRVDARFHCPDPRTIVMTIVDGDGRDSVVETHATPIDEGHTAIVEATLATSDRPGFEFSLHLSRWLRPLIERRAARLWHEDARYAERLYALRCSTDGRPRARGSHPAQA